MLHNIAETLPLLPTFVTILLLFIHAILLNQIALKQRLFPKNNYLPGMTYLLFVSLFISKIQFSDTLLASTILLWILSKICGLQNAANSKTLLFNIGLIFGIAVLIDHPAYIFITVIWFALMLTRPFRLPEWLVVLLGGFTTYYFIGSWLFLNGKKINSLFPVLELGMPKINLSTWELSALSFLLLIALYSIYFIHVNMRKLLVQSRNSWTIIFFYLFISIFVSFFYAVSDYNDQVFVLAPLALISAACFFYTDQKWVVNIMHWLLVAISIVINYYYCF